MASVRQPAVGHVGQSCRGELYVAVAAKSGTPTVLPRSAHCVSARAVTAFQEQRDQRVAARGIDSRAARVLGQHSVPAVSTLA
jgi:hypothetical protein